MPSKEIKTIGTDEYVSVNQLYNIPVGTAFNIQVQFMYGVRAHFGASKPPVETVAYRIIPALLTELYYVEQGSEELFLLGHAAPAHIQVEV
ncbi:hypothetical protein HRJ35_16270 [Shewanella oneidensis MR-1]|uniref:Lambda phage protein of known function n=1 Tax=Shewanella oneidensis (strain ATCC 700550 / JCM 31522 / CIP 106686 / LMG 19005 / NCIMB 14063 / MR-1) TaxID=211586 RepID=Q8ED24_SHEON|nr:Lambda phage protein of known function [Shewanella oneidensis]AAN55960.1 Lambda phage protein of known function [Shewanella oneidensis MR-1]MDX5999604.1 hypothetical protein [Shewanella oneidensis]MEE2027470.1 hypothetical protein [Shewanella oneidensis]QKG97406.1 hypothetical protein HRJ35_16270 [Shewanella oneidensis MR-1]